MEFVLDANILFSALIKESHTRHILLISDWTFYIPEYLFEEIEKHIRLISEKSGLTEKEIKDLLSELTTTADIRIIPFSEFSSYMDKAKKISPDPNDAHYLHCSPQVLNSCQQTVKNGDTAKRIFLQVSLYFALAMKMECAIWSNDKKLKEQNLVKVYSTADIINLLKR